MRGTTAAIAAGLLVAGCGNLTENVAEEAAESAIESEGGGDVDVELDAGGDAATVELEGEDGAQRFTVGGTEIPEGLTIPLFEGYEVVGSSTADSVDRTFLNVNLQYPAASASDVVLFYNGYFEDDPDITAFETSGDDLQSWSWSASDGSTQVVVTHSTGDEAVNVSVIETVAG
jgi:hypothetical protein